MTAEAEARVYYYANRIFRVEKKDEITPKDSVNSIIPNFFNPFIQHGSSPEESTFAAQFLVNLQQRLETGPKVPSRAERLATKFVVHKPEGMTRQEWVKFFSWFNWASNHREKYTCKHIRCASRLN